ncbi:MAG TPA: FHA domain-containing protein [Ktedonobacterales bacterium]
MDLTSGYTLLPVTAAIGGPVLVALGGLVVIIAILLVFVMVLRSNGDARKTSSGIGYDTHSGPYGQSRAPVSQPNRSRQAPWADDYPGPRSAPSRPGTSPASGSDWPSFGGPSAPAGANAGRGSSDWPSQGAGAWGGQSSGTPQWGGQPDPGNQPPWGAQPAGQRGGAGAWNEPAPRNDWGQQPEPQQNWGAPAGAGAPRGWDQPPAQGNPNWNNAPAGPMASGPQDWGAPAAAPAPGYGNRPDYGSANYGAGNYAEEQRTYVVRPPSAQGEPKLVVSEGKEPGRNYDIRKERITIGRSRDSDVFLEDLAVSRTHTTITRQPDGRYLLRDENSANGTLVNGQRVADQVLEDGDKIQVGQTLLVFVYR